MKRLPIISFLFLISALLLVLPGCDTPEKVMKSDDMTYKRAKAVSWYNKKDYLKAIPILEELISQMKGRQSTEELYYMYAMANYYQGDYMIAAYHFKNFYDMHPNSDKAEECLYMQGESFQRMSPKSELDQTYTFKAMEAYQYFLNVFPGSPFTPKVNEAVVVLRKKLEKKALAAADLYYRTSNFKAAATSYVNILKDYPDIEEGEKVTFMIVKSGFRYAENSISSKKSERYNTVIKNYNEFKYKFSKSKYLAEAKQYEQEAHYLAAKSAYEWADEVLITEKERYFNIFFSEAEAQRPFIIDEKELKHLNAMVEKGYFEVVKANYLISEERKIAEKRPSLEQTVKTYYIFVEKFPQSRYLKRAERIFNNTTEQLRKLKSNG